MNDGLFFSMTKLPSKMYRIRPKAGTSDFTQLKVNWPLPQVCQLSRSHHIPFSVLLL